MNEISEAAAWAIATVLNEACMDVRVEDIGRPAWKGATGTQVIAAAMTVINRGGSLGEELAGIDWLTVSFEEHYLGSGGWYSQELGFKK
jgi:hypothetical protein